jgi:hypothetical protein
MYLHERICFRKKAFWYITGSEIAIAKLKRFKSPGSDQIPAELIQAGGEILCSKIHKLINCLE